MPLKVNALQNVYLRAEKERGVLSEFKLGLCYAFVVVRSKVGARVNLRLSF